MAKEDFTKGPVKNKKRDTHTCSGYGAGSALGSTWTCSECGRNWTVTMVDEQGIHHAPLPKNPDETGLPLMIVEQVKTKPAKSKKS